LIEKIGVTEIVIQIPVTNFRKDIPGNLAAQCGISLHSDVGSDSEPAYIALSDTLRQQVFSYE
jgi:hypothetical protein